MIEGKTITQISRGPRNMDGTTAPILEQTHRVIKFRRMLPAGPMPDGGVRRKDLIQFWADPGGLRTVVAEDIVL